MSKNASWTPAEDYGELRTGCLRCSAPLCDICDTPATSGNVCAKCRGNEAAGRCRHTRWSRRDAASAAYQGLSLSQLDVEAEIEIMEGNRAGLIFRAGQVDYSVMAVNISTQTAELCRGSKSFNELTPPPSEPVSVPIEIRRKTWHTLRVKAVADTVCLYFDGRLLGQFHSPEVERSVIIPRSSANKSKVLFDCMGERLVVRNQVHDKLMPGDSIVEVNSVRSSTSAMKAEFYKAQGTILRVSRIEPGLVGIWVGRDTCARTRNFSVTDLSCFDKTIRDSSAMLALSAEQEARTKFEDKVRYGKRLMAAATIQRVAKARVQMMRHHLKLCAEWEAGKSDEQRQKMMLQWVTLMTFFNKVDDILHEPKIFIPLEQKYLEVMDETVPPPPPPPVERPPSKEEEDLLINYVEKSKLHCERAERAFLKDHERKKFEDMRSSHLCSATEKARIARKCFDSAQKATSEEEHQGLLRKAFCLEKDFMSMSDSNENEFREWLQAKEEALQEKERALKERSRLPTMSMSQ